MPITDNREFSGKNLSFIFYILNNLIQNGNFNEQRSEKCPEFFVGGWVFAKVSQDFIGKSREREEIVCWGVGISLEAKR